MGRPALAAQTGRRPEVQVARRVTNVTAGGSKRREKAWLQKAADEGARSNWVMTRSSFGGGARNVAARSRAVKPGAARLRQCRGMTPSWLLYHDDALIVVDKPAGLLAVPGRLEADCMAARVRALFADAQVVHRLDMATSGLMLLARGTAAQRRLSLAFMQRAVNKRYTAVVGGCIAHEHGSIALPLMADWPNRPRQKVDTVHGKPSLTRYRVLSRDAAAHTTRVALEPVTGRSHQLRVHLMAIGHSIVGDGLYADATLQAAAPRLLLHSAHIGFAHPGSGAPVCFDSAAPF
jgi:tRNA pseudouridine32 synthase/23S rRNA pseudouridine746 synthase